MTVSRTPVRYPTRVAGRCVNSPGRGHPRESGGNVTDATCTVDGCARPHKARGYCQGHYARVLRTGQPGPAEFRRHNTPSCELDGCGRDHYIGGFCRVHHERWQRHGSTDDPRPTTPERFWSKVDTSDRDGCWLWEANLSVGGYGQFHDDGQVYAHRWAYGHLVGPIPDGLEIDHLCRVRRCVNPSHLEPVTTRENGLRGEGIAAVNARKRECVNGHPYDEANTGWRRDGARWCRACKRERRARGAANA